MFISYATEGRLDRKLDAWKERIPPTAINTIMIEVFIFLLCCDSFGDRAVTGSRKHQFWEPKLSPPPLLQDIVLVIVSPRRPVSLGTVSRAASCFEVSTVRVAQPRCNYVTR